MNPDGINYLDLSDAFLQGNWEAAVNGTWSPLYPLLLSIARFIARPSPYWEFAVAHALNFIIYLFALAAFHFFLCQWLKDRRDQGVESDDSGTQPDPAWLFLGYALFMWTSLNLITLSKLVTDMCLAIFVYLATGLLLKIRSGSHSWGLFALLGLSLGLGYLAKANMFLLAFIFLIAAGLCIRNWRVLFPRLIVAFLFFCLLSSPFIISLSRAKGRPTFSEVGRLGYAWHVNGVTQFNGVKQFVHWQGEPPGNGTPKHPTRKIRDVPAVYEFATPIGGTFPPGFDPSYWYEGVEIDFNVAQQVRAVFHSLALYYQLFLLQGGVFVGWLIFLLGGQRGWRTLNSTLQQWPLLMPAFIALGLLLIIGHLESRHCAPWLVLMWLGLFGGCQLPGTEVYKQQAKHIIVAIVIFLAILVSHSTAREFAEGLRPVVTSHQPSHPQWEVAKDLQQMGIRPGEQVAYLRNSYRVDWARLARIKIIAEIPPSDVMRFWSADDGEKSEVIETLFSTGARAIIAEGPPTSVAMAGWQRIGQTEYYAWILEQEAGYSR